MALAQVTHMWTGRVGRDFLQLRKGTGGESDLFSELGKVWISGIKRGGEEGERGL